MISMTDKEIYRASQAIDKALLTITKENRGEVALRILSVIRNLNDHIADKVWKDMNPTQPMNINKVASKFSSIKGCKFIARFDSFLRVSVSHFTPTEEGSERLLIKYYKYILQLKKLVYDRYGMVIIENAELFLEDTDEQTKDYYSKVAAKIEDVKLISHSKRLDNYYIDKIKPFYINNKIYYEVTLEPADDKPNKFNRITAFTEYDIFSHYCVALEFTDTFINIFDVDFPIKVISDWQISIRPCEFNNFAKIINRKYDIKRSYTEYRLMMEFLKDQEMSLIDIIDMDIKNYNTLKSKIISEIKYKRSYIFEILDECRYITSRKIMVITF